MIGLTASSWKNRIGFLQKGTMFALLKSFHSREAYAFQRRLCYCSSLSMKATMRPGNFDFETEKSAVLFYQPGLLGGGGRRSRMTFFGKIEVLSCLSRRYMSQEGSNEDQKYEIKEKEAVLKTQSNINDKRTEKKDSKSSSRALARFRAMLNTFWEGCKQLLWIDARKAWATNKKLKRHDYDLTILTREELRHMRQTQKDIIKSLPVALLFFLPFIGYFAPVLGYLFPKKLLSQQFWNIEQKKKFAFEDHAKRSQYYLPLVQELGWSCKELKNEKLFRLCIQAIDGIHLQNKDILALKDPFQSDIITIGKMPRFHLLKLCKTWLLPVKWYVPSKVLREFLQYRIKQIIEDDAAIRRDEMSILSDLCVRQACHARGLDKYSFEIAVMKEWLEDWLNLTESLAEEDNSFIAHCAAVKTMNFAKEIERKQLVKTTIN